MTKSSEIRLIQFLVVGSAVSVGLFLTPSYSSEPVDLPKLFLLGLFASLLIGLSANSNNFATAKKLKVFSILSVGLLAIFTLVLGASGANFNDQFFGAQGRNTGYLAYVSLIVLSIIAAISSNKSFLVKLSWALLGVGALNSIYGILQTFKHDPIHWNNGYNPIIGFLGNPNFASSFIGFSSAIAIALLFRPSVQIAERLAYVLYLALATFIIYRSNSQQGLLVLGIGAIVIIFFRLKNSENVRSWITYSFAAISALVSVIVVLGIFKIGPMASHLYKYSVRQRGFYWNAAISMMKSHPIFGVGLDSFGNNYFKYRSMKAAALSPDVQSNAAHNVYLDLASNGGIPLVTIFILFNLYILRTTALSLFKAKEFNPYLVGLFGAWLGYQAQSLISINQLGLGIWGWVIGGALIGFCKLSGSEENNVNMSGRPHRRVKSMARTNWIVPAISFSIGLALFLPPFQTDHDYRVVLASRDANAAIAVSQKYPEITSRTLATAQLLANSKLVPQALQLANHIVKIDPLNYNAWVMIYQLSTVGNDQHSNAFNKMKALNPHDTRLK